MLIDEESLTVNVFWMSKIWWEDGGILYQIYEDDRIVIFTLCFPHEFLKSFRK